MAESQ
jgi:hypothetical protein